jgi:hypothetical protein
MKAQTLQLDPKLFGLAPFMNISKAKVNQNRERRNMKNEMANTISPGGFLPYFKAMNVNIKKEHNIIPYVPNARLKYAFIFASDGQYIIIAGSVSFALSPFVV